MATATKTQKSYRVQFKFWLDLARDLEAGLADYCASLKTQRLFSSTIRDAIRLIADLREQRLDVLFELFPWINAWMEERAEAIARAMIKPNQPLDNRGEGSDLVTKIERIEKLLLTQSASAGGGGMLMAARENILALPETLPDEPTIQITRAKADPDQIFQNFMSSLQSVGVTVSPQQSGVKPLLGAAVQFAAPDFDDLSL